MKILWLSHLVPFPPKAGVIQRSYHLLRQLSRDNEVHLLAFHQPSLMRPLVADPVRGLDEALQHLGRFCQIEGILPIPSDTSRFRRVGLVAVGAVGRLGYTMSWLRSRSYANRLRKLAEQNDFRLLHCDTISLAPYSQLVPGVPAVIDHHNVESHMMLRRATKEPNPFKAAYFTREARKLASAERTWCAAAAHNITCSDTDTARILESVPRAHVSTIPNGVDTAHFNRFRAGDEPRRLLFVGTMNWYPNVRAVEFLIRNVWPVLRELHLGLGIDIVGANAPAWLRDLAASEPQIRFHGFIDDVRPIMGEALAFVCPIDDGGGTKLKVLNAMAMSLPVIAHPIACEGIDIDDGETALLARTPSEYADAVRWVILNPAEARHMGVAARALVEQKYSVQVVGDKLRSLYDAIAGGNHRTQPPAR